MTTPAEPQPRLVRSYGYEAPELTGVTESAQPRYWPQGPKPTNYSTPATHAAQRAAFQQYETRPDIESRNSILARDHAQPGEFLPAQLAGGVVPGERADKMTVDGYKMLPMNPANIATNNPAEVYVQEEMYPYFTPDGDLNNDGDLIDPGEPNAPTVPAAPAAPTATALAGADVRVDWTAPTSDGGSAITGYTITSTTDATVTATVGVVLTHTFLDLVVGSTHAFTVTAINAVGSSPASAASNTVTVVT